MKFVDDDDDDDDGVRHVMTDAAADNVASQPSDQQNAHMSASRQPGLTFSRLR